MRGRSRCAFTGSEIDGRFAPLESLLLRGQEAHLNVRRREDEAYHVLDGKLDFTVGDTTWSATVGQAVFLPRNVPHRVTAQSESARTLILLTPAGLEGLLVRPHFELARRVLSFLQNNLP